jgi:ABC-type Fe3+/spermidine/putrescine transport system ATPase subunit
MLKLINIGLNYNDLKVVKNVSFDLKKGERLVIVGASGCGKTTLLKAIGGFRMIDKGEISFNNELIEDPTTKLVPGHDAIKLVNQDFNLGEFHTVEENIRLRLLQFDRKYLNERIEELLKLTELTKYRYAVAQNLSGGQKQRLAIARALADEPELLLLDEPFNQLDYHLRHKIEKYILEYLSKYNISSILVSHNGEEAMKWGDKIAFMKNGKLERFDTGANFYNKPSNKNEAGLFGVINTVLVDKKEVSFRPHQFATSESKEHSQLLNFEFKKIVNKGWFAEYHFKVGQRIAIFYSQLNISDFTQVWVKPIIF